MFSIEKPEKKDYQEIITVWEASVRATHHFLKEEDIQFFRPLILNEYLDAVDLYYVRDNDNISGFMGLSADAIEMLFIDPDSRDKGIGKLLAKFAIQQKNITKVDVNEDNVQAVGFYEKMGFAIISRSPVDGFGKPYPLLHMEFLHNQSAVNM